MRVYNMELAIIIGVVVILFVVFILASYKES